MDLHEKFARELSRRRGPQLPVLPQKPISVAPRFELIDLYEAIRAHSDEYAPWVDLDPLEDIFGDTLWSMLPKLLYMGAIICSHDCVAIDPRFVGGDA